MIINYLKRNVEYLKDKLVTRKNIWRKLYEIAKNIKYKIRKYRENISNYACRVEFRVGRNLGVNKKTKSAND